MPCGRCKAVPFVFLIPAMARGVQPARRDTTMDSGIYAATSALMARSQALDVLSNNLANVSTTGYKGESQFYQALNAASGQSGQGALSAAVNQFGVLAG